MTDLEGAHQKSGLIPAIVRRNRFMVLRGGLVILLLATPFNVAERGLDPGLARVADHHMRGTSPGSRPPPAPRAT